MSLPAFTWLASLKGEMTGNQHMVLFHLCHCHNPEHGCFPSQEYLREVTGLSNGGLNNALNALEAAGLIARTQRRDEGSKRQKSTLYTLGFEIKKPTPKSGDGDVTSRVPKREPPPSTAPSCLHLSPQSVSTSVESNKVKEQVNRTGKDHHSDRVPSWHHPNEIERRRNSPIVAEVAQWLAENESRLNGSRADVIERLRQPVESGGLADV